MRPLLLVAATALWVLPAQSTPSLPMRAGMTAFAPVLAARASLSGPDAWRALPVDKAWRAIAQGQGGNRQPARWDYARALIGAGLGAEALGVLGTMVQDEPALDQVDSYRLARGVTLIHLRRHAEAIDQLGSAGLAANPEACVWRLRALDADGQPVAALRQLACARPALAARPARERRDAILAASRSALAVGHAARALDWLRQIPARDPTANLLRAQALRAADRHQEADRLLASVARAGSPAEQVEARLARVEAAVARRLMPARAALGEAERIRYAWRGDAIEVRALRLSYRLSSQLGDLRAALTAGSTLFHHVDAHPDRAGFILGLQRQLAATLDPANGLTLDQAAGLYWDFRDLAPIGAEGDLLVARLAQRLQDEGLYARAAELLGHQLEKRAQDLAKGPLSARVAALHILAGHPKLALAAIRASERSDYPASMRWERQRIEAVALVHLGREGDALAALDAVPGGVALRAEIHWRRREWSLIEATTRKALPRARELGEVEQTIVLRHAVALAMLGREGALKQLRGRYAPAFAGLPSARAFEVLTAPVGTVDQASLGAALAAIPAASPAGALGDLLDAVPAA